MKFRPCIDIHNGQVKQIVGGSLKDEGDRARENFVSGKDAAYYAGLYQKDGLKGGHVILLNGPESVYYEKTRRQAFLALQTYPGGLQIGGGVSPENALEYLRAGASHVIVTSYVFRNGEIHYENIKKISHTVGKNRLVLDLSCRKRDGIYYVVTDRWQKFTEVPVTNDLLRKLEQYCDEFLIHGVDVEGKSGGIEEGLLCLLGEYQGIKITYAGGVGTWEDLEKVRKWGKGRIDVTVGSALDLFGGSLPYEKLVNL